MTITKTRLGTSEDGTPLYHYESDGHVVLTGPIVGTVKLANGTEVDVTDAVIEVPSEKAAAEVVHLIGKRYAAEGHPSHTDGAAFEYVAPTPTPKGTK